MAFTNMNYTFIDHLHNFSVWTAARASQRNFTTTKNIKEAIEKTPLKKLIVTNKKWNPKSFDVFHKECCNTIIKYLKNKRIKTTYGRAAKIIAIYIKTSIVIPSSGKSILAKIAHPPIDNILLTNLHRKYRTLNLGEAKWTYLTERQYCLIIKKLRALNFDKFWEIEMHWSPIQNK